MFQSLQMRSAFINHLSFHLLETPMFKQGSLQTLFPKLFPFFRRTIKGYYSKISNKKHLKNKIN